MKMQEKLVSGLYGGKYKVSIGVESVKCRKGTCAIDLPDGVLEELLDKIEDYLHWLEREKSKRKGSNMGKKQFRAKDLFIDVNVVQEALNGEVARFVKSCVNRVFPKVEYCFNTYPAEWMQKPMVCGLVVKGNWAAGHTDVYYVGGYAQPEKFWGTPGLTAWPKSLQEQADRLLDLLNSGFIEDMVKASIGEEEFERMLEQMSSK